MTACSEICPTTCREGPGVEGGSESGVEEGTLCVSPLPMELLKGAG